MHVTLSSARPCGRTLRVATQVQPLNVIVEPEFERAAQPVHVQATSSGAAGVCSHAATSELFSSLLPKSSNPRQVRKKRSGNPVLN
jgi:hypothetical protein